MNRTLPARDAVAEHPDPSIPLIAGVVLMLIPIFVHLLLSPLLLPIAAAVGAASGLLAFSATRQAAIAMAAGGVAAVLVTSTTGGLAALLLVALVLAALTLRSQIPLLAAAVGLFWAHPAGSALLAVGIALAVAWPAPHHPLATPWRRTITRLILPLAALLAVAGIVLAHIAWSGLAGLAAGLVARSLDRHPANVRLAAATARGALYASPLPAFFLFLLAALGRLPPLSPLRTLGVAWAAVGLGLLVILIGAGIAVLFHAAGPWNAVALAAVLATILLVTAGTFQAILLGGRLAGPSWAILTPWAALGAARLGARIGAAKAWGMLIIVASTIPGLRLLIETQI